MIFQLSDWFPKPIIWAIIVKFDQIRKNWWQISCAGRKKVFPCVVGKENVTICGGFIRWNQLRIAWKFTKTVILLGLAGYELIITNSAYGLIGYIYISSYPTRPRRITVKYQPTSGLMQILHFDWLHYYRSISNSHWVAKFTGFVKLFILFYSQINFFFAEFIIAFFCPNSWVILKQYHGSIAHSASPHGLLLYYC